VARCGSEAMAAFAPVRAGEMRRLKSRDSGEPAARHFGLPLAVSCGRVPTRWTAKPRRHPAEDSLVSPPGITRSRPKTIARSFAGTHGASQACGTPGKIRLFAVNYPVCTFHFRAGGRGDRMSPASPPPLFIGANGVNAKRAKEAGANLGSGERENASACAGNFAGVACVVC
jgi:hypothetical protein